MNLRESLPQEFDFYHLGLVEQRPRADQDLDAPWIDVDKLHVGFRIHGDWAGLLVLSFDRGLDASTYTEMGNIIASQFSERLGRSEGWDLLISPPMTVTAEQLRRSLGPALPAVRTGYFHVHENVIVRLEVAVFANLAKEEARASRVNLDV